MPTVEPIALQLHARPWKWFGANIYRDERHPTSKRGGINRLGPPKNIGASIAASGCHMIGEPVSDRGWKRAFEDPIALPSRDFVPWRFLDAGRHSAWKGWSCRHPKTCTTRDTGRSESTSLILVAWEGYL
jgi:hypothetical protein